MNSNRKTIHLNFGNNVYQNLTKNLIPFKRGIYIAYTGKFNGSYVELNKLLYIGKADSTSIAQRIEDHTQKQHDEWKQKHCKSGEDIYYRVANIESDIRNIEANMIFRHKPPCNEEDVDHYNGSIPAPNITTDISIPDLEGEITDILRLM